MDVEIGRSSPARCSDTRRPSRDTTSDDDQQRPVTEIATAAGTGGRPNRSRRRSGGTGPGRARASAGRGRGNARRDRRGDGQHDRSDEQEEDPGRAPLAIEKAPTRSRISGRTTPSWEPPGDSRFSGFTNDLEQQAGGPRRHVARGREAHGQEGEIPEPVHGRVGAEHGVGGLIGDQKFASHPSPIATHSRAVRHDRPQDPGQDDPAAGDRRRPRRTRTRGHAPARTPIQMTRRRDGGPPQGPERQSSVIASPKARSREYGLNSLE